MIYSSNKFFRVVIIYVTLISLISGCSHSTDESVNWEDITIGGQGTDSAANYPTADETEDYEMHSPEQAKESSDEQIQKVYGLVKDFFLTVEEYPINTDIYDSEMDKEYKEAFLEYIFHKEPMTYNVYRGEEVVPYNTFRYTFADDIGRNWYIPKKHLLFRIINSFKYWYFDYDGDGMPELVISHRGKTSVSIYKYNPEKKCVYLYFAGDRHDWFFMYPRTLDRGCQENEILVRYDPDGNEIINLKLITEKDQNTPKYLIRYYNQENADNIIDESAYVDEEIWNKTSKLVSHAFDVGYLDSSMTFEEVFGDFASPYINIERWKWDPYN